MPSFRRNERTCGSKVATHRLHGVDERARRRRVIAVAVPGQTQPPRLQHDRRRSEYCNGSFRLTKHCVHTSRDCHGVGAHDGVAERREDRLCLLGVGKRVGPGANQALDQRQPVQVASDQLLDLKTSRQLERLL
jgi:hypothetical protein